MNPTSWSRSVWGGLVLGGVVLLTAMGSAEAHSPYLQSYCGHSGWSVYVREHIPYYAKHPPVYYSYPVARAYGFSPYAYPATMVTPELAPPRPAVVPSHFIPIAQRSEAQRKEARPKPLRIKNRFFDGK